MAALIKGTVAQLTTESIDLEWSAPQAWKGNEIKHSSIYSIDVSLDSTRYHFSIPYQGCEPYLVDGQSYFVEKGDYFMFNPQQSVRAEGQFAEAVKGYCILLTESTVQAVAQSLQESLATALEDPFHLSWQQQAFMVKTYSFKENAFGQYLKQIQQMLLSDTEQLVDWDTFYYELAQAFLQTHRQIAREIAAIPAIQAATRKEAYRRITLAHAYIQENYTQSFSLDQLSKVALLSKFHLIRLYRAVYQQTPYQTVLQLRMARAKQLLLTNYSATEVAYMLSFSDRRAFSKAFKKWVGMTPSVFAAKR